MEKIYIAFVDTPGLFASALHGYLKQKYIHVLLSLDENLDEAYSLAGATRRFRLWQGMSGRIRSGSCALSRMRIT